MCDLTREGCAVVCDLTNEGCGVVCDLTMRAVKLCVALTKRVLNCCDRCARVWRVMELCVTYLWMVLELSVP